MKIITKQDVAVVNLRVHFSGVQTQQGTYDFTENMSNIKLWFHLMNIVQPLSTSNSTQFMNHLELL